MSSTTTAVTSSFLMKMAQLADTDWDHMREGSIFLPTFVFLCAAYLLLGARFPVPKQSAWVLSAIASGCMTVASLPFVWDYFMRGDGGVGQVRDRGVYGVAVNRFFQGYLCADLLMGAIYYRTQVNLLTGWIHHIVYVGICELAVRREWTHVFGLAACMEFPTFLLGAATLDPRLRSNVAFAAAFFITRIFFHLCLIVSYVLPHNRPSGSLVPCGILIAVFPMHAMWFHGCIQGFIRRAKQVAGKAGTPPSTHPLSPDIHTDARALARHAAPMGSVRPVWDVTLRLRRLRSRFIAGGASHGEWIEGVRNGSWVDGVRDRVVERAVRMRSRLHAATATGERRPIRPRALAMGRRMSAGLIAVLPSLPTKEFVLDYVGLSRP